MGRIKDKQIENISADKIINLNDKNFVSDKTLNIINNFSINENGILVYNGSAIGGVPILREIHRSFTLSPLETKYVALPVGFSKYDLRTLLLSSTGPVTIDIYDNCVNGFLVYSSCACMYKYDVINIPCEDKSGKNNVNLVISNDNIFLTCVSINIKITSLA
ncbi:hypothetical protein [Clostridium felsineum]|uniref:hypothetical protein n=1 Tax=Clostridium felsineum TaxID=36839 RepID=UPI00098CBDA1|nr:hypothetical protein [Clostridium felsineum]URZ18512.1 hypothetical protein CLFE_046000 [Clostridium felsineum DSM 794]